jgi:hypothetical protein
MRRELGVDSEPRRAKAIDDLVAQREARRHSDALGLLGASLLLLLVPGIGPFLAAAVGGIGAAAAWEDALDLKAAAGAGLVPREEAESAALWATVDTVLVGLDVAAAVGSLKVVKVAAARAQRFLGLAGRLGKVGEAGEAAQKAVRLGTALAEDADLLKAISWIKPQPGVWDVVVHGSSDSFWVLRNGKWLEVDHRALATLVRKTGWKGEPIRLISCNTGKDAFISRPIAQELANKLGVEVRAPTDTLWVHSNGQMTIGPQPTSNTGSWAPFRPGIQWEWLNL